MITLREKTKIHSVDKCMAMFPANFTKKEEKFPLMPIGVLNPYIQTSAKLLT